MNGNRMMGFGPSTLRQKLMLTRARAYDNLSLVNNMLFYVCDVYLDDRKLEMRRFLSKGCNFFAEQHFVKFLISFVSHCC